MGSFSWEDVSDMAVLESADIEFSGYNGTEQIEIIAMEEVESSPTALAIMDGFGDLIEITDGRGGIVDRGDKIEVSAICGLHQFEEDREAVNGLFNRRDLHSPCSIAMFHPSVVFEERDVIGHCFDAKNHCAFIVHLDGDLFHVVLDACSFNAGMKIIAYFPIELPCESTTKKCGDMVGFHRMDGGTHQLLVNGLQFALALEDDIHGILNLHEAPMITG